MDGNELGHFTLLEKIGEGGMGRVCKARDTRLERLVAIKLLAESKGADGRTPCSLHSGGQGRLGAESSEHRHHP